ncbi:QacE family quaternary ammonium compound efflux SMR transporter [Entomomonas moraniae]|uniref:Spermidine export protein MdtJ n=1 Tax=Entomomonas moraniae TaxID=2213226 RepID=A0A3Q9JNQ6_9GAMM|nr:multidrug efflux SMR transporter [Entomomonas moraniae]AZS51225.1 QacE family quaternary ammonium compound efflux SMR transporter [Entomomonas moraniae]
MRAWSFLFLAVFFEVTGTSSIKLFDQHFPMLGLIVMYGLIGISYFCLSLSLKKVPVGVAYAIWEGIGIVLITIVSVLLFDEHISVLKVVSLVLIIVGILLIKSGTKSGVISSDQKADYSVREV